MGLAERMSETARPVRAGKRAISIQDLLVWAFRAECAQLNIGAGERFGGELLPSFGLEYVMIERARLGCRVDGGGRSEPHPDADVVASAVSVLPEGLGGIGMAIRIAELARAGMTPDWMPGAKPKCLPLEWRQHKHGPHAATTVVGVEVVRHRGRKVRHEIRACPVTYVPTPSQIGSARRGYLAWCSALLELRCQFQTCGGLSCWSVTDAMPPMRPWMKKNS